MEPREFYESHETRVDPAKAKGMNASYRFDIDGAGSWNVDVDDGKVTVTEGGGEADTTISTSAETFTKIANGEQNPTAARSSSSHSSSSTRTMPPAMRSPSATCTARTVAS